MITQNAISLKKKNKKKKKEMHCSSKYTAMSVFIEIINCVILYIIIMTHPMMII